MEARANRLRNERFTMFGAEDQMNQDFGKGLRHGCFALTGRENGGGRVPRAVPWADESKPFGLDATSWLFTRKGPTELYTGDINQHCQGVKNFVVHPIRHL